MTGRVDADVVVVGAGMAGLAAADRLTAAGVSTLMVEARNRPGGRIRADGDLQVGGEFVGPPHLRLRALITRLGLHTRPVPRSGPILWRTGEAARLGRLPPVPAAEVARSVRALARIRRDAAALDPQRPWAGPGAAALDEVSVADYLQAVGAGPVTGGLLGALIAGFATADVESLSALQAAWWIGRAGGLAAALASGTGSQITAGADALPARYADTLTGALAASPAYQTTVIAVDCRDDRLSGVSDAEVRLCTTAGELRARAVVLAVPLPALRRIRISPPLPDALTAALTEVKFGAAAKISALVEPGHPIRARAAIGGAPLGIAWRTGPVIAGIARGGGHDHRALLDDLLTVFDLAPEAVGASVSHDWSRDPWAGGSYITFAPGQLTRHAPALNRPHGRVAFAAAERSSWPNSIEGALESGEAAAARVRGLLGAD